MISMSNINFSYSEKKVLENFNLEVAKGEKICLFGESGSGKTTILRLILGLEKQQSGTTLSGGKAVAVFQENRLLPYLTVMQNFEAVKGDTKVAKALLKEFSLLDYKDKYPRNLSGGMKRRVAIIRALCCEYDLLILDEPFAGLDKENIELAADIINRYAKDKTIVLVSHSKWEAELLNAKIVDIK